MPRLVIVTNVPTPYRIAFFNILADELKHVECDVHVVYCAEREPHRRWKLELESQRYPWIILKGIHPRIGPTIAHLNPAIISTVMRLRPRWVLLAGSWNTPTIILANAFLRGKAARVFWSEGHADAVRYSAGPIAWLRRATLRTFDGFAVPNDRSKDFIHDLVGKDKPVLRLPNSVDEEFYRGGREMRSRALKLRAKYSLPQDRILIVAVAQAVERKGLGRLLAAYATLPAQARARLGLVHVGSGPLVQSLADQAKGILGGSVSFLGERPAEDLREVLAASDVFALPSLADPNPLAPIEAALAGLPLILSKRAGNWADLIGDDVASVGIDPDDPDSISAALLSVAGGSREELRRRGAITAERVERQFGRKRIARSFVAQLLATFPGN